MMKSWMLRSKLSMEEAQQIINKGVSVVVFPEGTRSFDGKIQKFKKGGFVLAVDSGVPIIPVIIHGTWPIMPKKQILIKPGHVVLEIAKPIKSSDYTRKSKEDLMEKVRNVLIESFEKSNKDKSLC